MTKATAALLFAALARQAASDSSASSSDSSASSGPSSDSSGAASEDTSGSGSSGMPQWFQDITNSYSSTFLCKQIPADDIVSTIWADGATQTLAADATEADRDFFFSSLCAKECPSPLTPNFKYQCQEGAHDFRSTFRTMAGQAATLQWEVIFIIFWLLVGAASRRLSPSWLPYTVWLLMLGILLGGIAELVEQDPQCPHNLMLSDHDHDGKVSRQEFDAAICVGCHADSFCLTAQQRSVKAYGTRTCGDGSAEPSGCPWTFESLDATFKKSNMLPEEVTAGAGDGYLTADELWSGKCNGLRDLLILSDMDPHYLLVLFLPALLFESAVFGVDIGILRKQIVQICLMAFPAMAVASAITGLLIYAVTEGQSMDWTFWHCWLVGIICSATDPVAVVALLKDLGAAKTLGTLIEGESLLNDGSAVVLFTWVRNVIGYDHSTVGPRWMFSANAYNTTDVEDPNRYEGQTGSELLRVVTQMLLLGLLMGYVAGKICVYLLRRVYEDVLVEISLLAGISYLTFWLGELLMGSSAVIAVVVMGFIVNQGKSAISPGSLHTVHVFYETIAHFLNTVLFAIAGIKLGIIFASGAFLKQRGQHLWWAIYPIVLIARGVAVALFFPIIKRFGTGCDWKDAVIMWWGGLRGSVGLALALALMHTAWSHDMWGGEMNARFDNPVLPCIDVPENTLLMTCMVVLATVCINGLTMAPLMKALGKTATPEERCFALKKARHHIDEKCTQIVEELKGEEDHLSANWGEVAAVVRLPKDATLETPEARECRNAWLHVLQMERFSYLAQYERGTLDPASFGALEELMSDMMAHCHTLSDPEQLSKDYDAQLGAFLKRLGKAKGKKGVGRAWGAAVAYKLAMHEVQHLIHGDASYATVVKEHEDNVEQIKAFLSSLRQEQPELCKNLETKHAAELVLRKQCEMIQHLQHEGALADLDVTKLLKAQMAQLRKLDTAAIETPMEKITHGASKMQKAKAKVQVKLQAVKKERASKRDSKNSSTATITKGERSANDVPVAEPSPFAASGAAQPSSATADDEEAAPAPDLTI